MKVSCPRSQYNTSYPGWLLPNAEITVPNVTRDLLMLAPSFNLLPVAPVEFALSLQQQSNY